MLLRWIAAVNFHALGPVDQFQQNIQAENTLLNTTVYLLQISFNTSSCVKLPMVHTTHSLNSRNKHTFWPTLYAELLSRATEYQIMDIQIICTLPFSFGPPFPDTMSFFARCSQSSESSDRARTKRGFYTVSIGSYTCTYTDNGPLSA